MPKNNKTVVKNSAQRHKKWKARLDTDILEFCVKEGIPAGRGDQDDWVTHNLGHIIYSVYQNGTEKIKTIRNLMTITKAEFDYCAYRYLESCYCQDDVEKYWNKLNNALKRHGFRMYIKGRIFD